MSSTSRNSDAAVTHKQGSTDTYGPRFDLTRLVTALEVSFLPENSLVRANEHLQTCGSVLRFHLNPDRDRVC